jgi:hypothetical protein
MFFGLRPTSFYADEQEVSETGSVLSSAEELILLEKTNF